MAHRSEGLNRFSHAPDGIVRLNDRARETSDSDRLICTHSFFHSGVYSVYGKGKANQNKILSYHSLSQSPRKTLSFSEVQLLTQNPGTYNKREAFLLGGIAFET